MCRSKEKGGKRCVVNNARRRDRYAVRTAAEIVDQVIAKEGSEWTGDVKGIDLEINSPLIAKSYAIAVRAHAGVKRKTGEVYINHPIRVAQKLQEAGFNDEVVSIALLHDAVEDSSLTLGDLRHYGYNERVVSGVDAVTKRDGEPYSEAIERATSHPLGRLVKLSDNWDNSSDEQLAPFDQAKQDKQRAKYGPARKKILRLIVENPTDYMLAKHPAFSATYRIKVAGAAFNTPFDPPAK